MLSNSKVTVRLGWFIFTRMLALDYSISVIYGHKRLPTITGQHHIIKDNVTMMSKNTNKLATVHPPL